MIFLLIFITTSTNNLYTYLSLLIFFVCIILLFLSFIITNFHRKLQIGKILLVSVGALCFGIIAIQLQKSLNQYNAEKLIAEIEKFKIEKGKYPDENEIKIPYSINGIDIEKMKYFKNSPVYKTDYVIGYFDGLIDEKLYFSDRKQWYIDD